MQGKEQGEEEEQVDKMLICRYGRGCTHIHDVVHREKFWHPVVPRLSGTRLFFAIAIAIAIAGRETEHGVCV